MKLSLFPTCIITSSLILLNSCFVEEIITPHDDEISQTFIASETQERATTHRTSKAQLVAEIPRILRRVYLDVLGKLPTLEERAEIDNEAKLLQTIEHTLTNPRFAKNIALKHRLLFQRTQASTPDLERFALSDSDLNTALTPELKLSLLQTPLLKLQYLIEQELPFSTFFSSSFMILSQQHLDMLNLTSSDLVYFGKDYYFYEDEKLKNLGILGSHGYAAGYESQTNKEPDIYRALRYAQLHYCSNYTHKTAHDFSVLEPSEISNISHHLKTTPSCASCHKPLNNLASLWDKHHKGADITNWMKSTYQDSQALDYNGHTVKDHTLIGQYLSLDPRLVLCEVENLSQTILQQDLVLSHQNYLHKLSREFIQSDLNIKKLVEGIIFSQHYLGTRADPLQEVASQVRFLSSHELMQILAQLGFEQPIDYLHLLDPGFEPQTKTQSFLPTSTYLASVKKLMATAAPLIYTRELQNYDTETRNLFIHLPPDEIFLSSPNQIKVQISHLWTFLTGYKKIPSKDLEHLYAIWTTTLALKDGSQTSRAATAWKLLLRAVLTSPEFLTY